MPTRIGPAGSIRVAITGTCLGQNVVNVFWASITTSGVVTQADLDTWTTAFGAAFKTRFTSYLNSNYSFSSVSATYFVDGTATNVLQSTQAMTGAATGGSSLYNDVCIVASWLSAAYWRGGKPRTYLCASGTNFLASTNSRFNATYVTNVNTAATNFRGDINALTAGTTIASTKLGIVSFTTNGAARVPPLFIAFTGNKVHPRIASQRRRRGKWVS